MPKLFFENDSLISNGQENFLQIREQDPQDLIYNMLLADSGNPSIVIRAIVDLCVEEKFLRALDLFNELKQFTHGEDETVVKIGGQDVAFNYIVSLLIVEYAYILAQINHENALDAATVISNTKKFGRAHELIDLTNPLESAESHQQLLSKFNFYGEAPSALFEAMFINHLLDKNKLVN